MQLFYRFWRDVQGSHQWVETDDVNLAAVALANGTALTVVLHNHRNSTTTAVLNSSLSLGPWQRRRLLWNTTLQRAIITDDWLANSSYTLEPFETALLRPSSPPQVVTPTVYSTWTDFSGSIVQFLSPLQLQAYPVPLSRPAAGLKTARLRLSYATGAAVFGADWLNNTDPYIHPCLAPMAVTVNGCAVPVDLTRTLPGMVRVDAKGTILTMLQLPLDVACLGTQSAAAVVHVQFPCNTTITSVALHMTADLSKRREGLIETG